MKVYREGRRILAQINAKHPRDIDRIVFVDLSLEHLFEKAIKDKGCRRKLSHFLGVINPNTKERLMKHYSKKEDTDVYTDLESLADRPALYKLVYDQIILNNLKLLNTETAEIDKIQENSRLRNNRYY